MEPVKIIVQEATKHSYSKATTFILPMLGCGANEYSGLKNCFVADFNQPDFSLNFNQIFILTSKPNSYLKHDHHFTAEYRTSEGDYMYVMAIPLTWKDDYKLFLESKYSQFSDTYKDYLVGKLTKVPVSSSSVYKVLYKSVEARKQIEARIGQVLPADAEVLSKIDFKQETYGFEQLEAETLKGD